jgi:hypothetical protein
VTGDSRVGFTLTSSLFAKAFAALERESPSLSLSVRDSKLQVWKKKICMLLYIVSKSVASCAVFCATASCRCVFVCISLYVCILMLAYRYACVYIFVLYIYISVCICLYSYMCVYVPSSLLFTHSLRHWLCYLTTGTAKVRPGFIRSHRRNVAFRGIMS